MPLSRKQNPLHGQVEISSLPALLAVISIFLCLKLLRVRHLLAAIMAEVQFI